MVCPVCRECVGTRLTEYIRVTPGLWVPCGTDLRFRKPRPPRFQNERLKVAAAARLHRAACFPQVTRRRTGFIRATPLSEDPQSSASRLIARPERSTPIL